MLNRALNHFHLSGICGSDPSLPTQLCWTIWSTVQSSVHRRVQFEQHSVQHVNLGYTYLLSFFPLTAVGAVSLPWDHCCQRTQAAGAREKLYREPKALLSANDASLWRLKNSQLSSVATSALFWKCSNFRRPCTANLQRPCVRYQIPPLSPLVEI